MLDNIIKYIILFLIGDENKELLNHIGYTADKSQYEKYSLVIKPSNFFSTNIFLTKASIPSLPLRYIEGIPILFGNPSMYYEKRTLILEADLIASAFFLLSRYEEVISEENKDLHGRFIGKLSLPAKAGFIHRPIVDEYSLFLRNLLKNISLPIKPIEKGIKKIWLTHDIDSPFYCRTIRSIVRETIKGYGLKNALKILSGKVNSDPFYTFPYFFKKAKELKESGKNVEICCFIKSGGRGFYDKPIYSIWNNDFGQLLDLCKSNNVTIGLHTSYDAGIKNNIQQEKDKLERLIKSSVKYNRHHYLATRNPNDLDCLYKTGITDDFTLGYADISGFRLGTSKPVNKINPLTFEISPLKLHPLTIMDCSLSEKKYMGLGFQEAYNYSINLINEVSKVNGELILLWHNDSVTSDVKPNLSVNWQKKLYSNIINKLKEI